MRDTANHRVIANVRVSAVVSLAGALIPVMAGCGKPQRYPPAVLFAAIDASASSARMLKDNRNLLARCDAGLGPKDRIVLYRIDHATGVAYVNEPHKSQEDALRMLKRELPTAASQPGTHPERFFTDAANQADRLPFLVFAAWDGENTDQSARSFNAIQGAARKLSRNPRCLGVLVYGVKKENQREFQRAFSPLESAGKLHYWPDSDRRPVAVLERIHVLRRNATQRIVAARTP
jgi:hypothetical protein